MEQIIIQPLTEKNMVNIFVPDATEFDEAKAYLLGTSGEHLQHFLLNPGNNDIRLKKQKPGMYTLRIETNNEVAVKQIFITR